MNAEDLPGALRAWFLGPHAENAALLERLILEALRDHVFWRRNFHPEDGAVISEIDKRAPGYDAAVATMTQELMGLLAELKRGVPFFSGRYKGHMSFEQTLASQIGYFAAMLYNPNNVAIEASPVTTRLELEVASQLARMVGYETDRAWGHLSSGGTIANFEALWVARNIIYLPVAAAGAADELGASLDVARADGSRAPLHTLPLWELVNIPVRATLDLWEALWDVGPRADVHRALTPHLLATAGYQDYARRLARAYGDPLPDAVVMVAATAHYSWEKIVRALGIGSNQLVHVPVDTRFRMDPDALWERVRALAARRQPILACVSVCGTTEESAVDRLDEVLAVRARAERELGVSFHVHSDAAYGGYAAAVTWRRDATRRPAAEIRAGAGHDTGSRGAWPSDEWVRAMEALSGADSVTIDPHKLGYIPYPAGAIVFRDRRARDLVAIDPPYLLPSQGMDSAEDLFLGRFIFEGSKPGAAAAAVWLSHKVLPLDESGYGYLIERTAHGARRLHGALAVADLGECSIVLLPEPDINIVCYIVRHPALRSLAEINELNESIYGQMSLGAPGATPEYIITRTRFQPPMYEGAVDPLLAALAIPREEWRGSGADGLVVLRSTVMDPYLADPEIGARRIGGFIAALQRAAEAAVIALSRARSVIA